MKHNRVRTVLVILLAIAAAFDIVYSIAVLGTVQLLPGMFTVIVVQLMPMSDFTVPMILLALVVGGSALLAAVTVFIRHEWSVFLSAAAGLIMIAWEVIEVAMFQRFLWLEVLFMAIGLLVIGLASYLWETEYRSHHFPVRHIGHVSHA